MLMSFKLDSAEHGPRAEELIREALRTHEDPYVRYPKTFGAAALLTANGNIYAERSLEYAGGWGGEQAHAVLAALSKKRLSEPRDDSPPVMLAAASVRDGAARLVLPCGRCCEDLKSHIGPDADLDVLGWDYGQLVLIKLSTLLPFPGGRVDFGLNIEKYRT